MARFTHFMYKEMENPRFEPRPLHKLSYTYETILHFLILNVLYSGYYTISKRNYELNI